MVARFGDRRWAAAGVVAFSLLALGGCVSLLGGGVGSSSGLPPRSTIIVGQRIAPVTSETTLPPFDEPPVSTAPPVTSAFAAGRVPTRDATRASACTAAVGGLAQLAPSVAPPPPAPAQLAARPVLEGMRAVPLAAARARDLPPSLGRWLVGRDGFQAGAVDDLIGRRYTVWAFDLEDGAVAEATAAAIYRDLVCRGRGVPVTDDLHGGVGVVVVGKEIALVWAERQRILAITAAQEVSVDADLADVLQVAAAVAPRSPRR